MPSLESMPVERSRVSASVAAGVPRRRRRRPARTRARPSWTTVRPPADTNRRAGKVGRPNSSGRPSAVEPPGDDGEGALGLGGGGRLGAGAGGPAAGGRAHGLTKRVDHPHRLLVGPQLDRGHDRHLVVADPCLGRAVDVVGPAVGGGDRPRWPAPGHARPPTPTTASGASTSESVRGRGVVVGVAEVAAVDQAAEAARCPSTEKVPSAGSTTTVTRPLAMVTDAVARSVTVDRVGQGAGLEAPPAEPGHLGHPGGDPPDRAAGRGATRTATSGRAPSLV